MTASVAELEASATVLAAYNNSSSPASFAVSEHGLAFSYTLPARATVTFIWR